MPAVPADARALSNRNADKRGQSVRVVSVGCPVPRRSGERPCGRPPISPWQGCEPRTWPQRESPHHRCHARPRAKKRCGQSRRVDTRDNRPFCPPVGFIRCPLTIDRQGLAWNVRDLLNSTRHRQERHRAQPVGEPAPSVRGVRRIAPAWGDVRRPARV